MKKRLSSPALALHSLQIESVTYHNIYIEIWDLCYFTQLGINTACKKNLMVILPRKAMSEHSLHYLLLPLRKCNDLREGAATPVNFLSFPVIYSKKAIYCSSTAL